MENYVGVYGTDRPVEKQQLETRAPEEEMRLAPRIKTSAQVLPGSFSLLPDLCPLALCPHLYLADLNVPCIKMMCVGISLSPNKWISITCGLVFNLSSFGKLSPGKPSFPLSFVVGNVWLHLQSQGHELIISPLCNCFREGCTI